MIELLTLLVCLKLFRNLLPKNIKSRVPVNVICGGFNACDVNAQPTFMKESGKGRLNGL